MDDIVRQAMAKWPNVPHCYGWLALDARGAWRMRDERAQHLNLPGDRLTNAALVGFINRNYARDDRGCWYFQNGPQRVYVSLQATPYIARTDPGHGLVLQTGEPVLKIDEAFITSSGTFIIREHDRVASVDDRDVARILEWLRYDDLIADDTSLLHWLETPNDLLKLRYAGRSITVNTLPDASVEGRLEFTRDPTPPSPSAV